jgi:hypothetical protein
MIKVFEDGSEAFHCDHCEEVVNHDDFIHDIDNDRVYCDLQCKGSDEQNRAEAAWESYCDRYYGGEIVTQAERYIEAWEEKRKG